MKYEVGDRVRIKSLDWYNENKDEYGYVRCTDFLFTPEHSKYCGCEFTISHITEFRIPSYVMENNGHEWTDEMIEGLVEEETTNIMDEDKMLICWIKEPNKYRLVPDKDYEIKYDEKGFFYLEKKKKEYPKTYEECYEITGLLKTSDIYGYKNGLLFEFQKLLIARDAYWKIAGEEMRLGKPWEPDWTNEEWPDMAYISYDGKSIDKENGFPCCNMILIFPSAEMRDDFYEAFRKEIEICKELL